MTATAVNPEQPAKPSYKDNWAVFDKKNKQHLNVLSRAIQLTWSEPHPVYDEVADLAKLSEWLKSDKSPVNKPLKEMDTKEVSQVLKALGIMVKKLYK